MSGETAVRNRYDNVQKETLQSVRDPCILIAYILCSPRGGGGGGGLGGGWGGGLGGGGGRLSMMFSIAM